jgi:hypothetical protein
MQAPKGQKALGLLKWKLKHLVVKPAMKQQACDVTLLGSH